jgi:hypothetical protein
MAQTHSTDALHASHGTPVSNVQEDKIDLRAIFGFAFGLAIVIVVVEIAMVVWFRMGVSAIDASNPPKVFPLAALPDDRRPPEPRLQEYGQSREDLKNLRAAEDDVLNGYRWVDRNRNIVRIPVADAMKLTLQRGLPAREQAATAASATQGTQGTSK